MNILFSEIRKHRVEANEKTVMDITSFLEDECMELLGNLTLKLLVLCPLYWSAPFVMMALLHIITVLSGFFAVSGVTQATKFTLCCKSCKLYLGYSQYGNKGELGFT